jgi:catechol 1,2-dioxygenase
MVTGEKYKTVVTQIYPKDDPWLETDTVFAVKDDLVVDFTPVEGDSIATLEMKYDFVLAPKGINGVANL